MVSFLTETEQDGITAKASSRLSKVAVAIRQMPVAIYSLRALESLADAA
jgi:hypothetical protein